ncbi:hypothetical protein TPA0910_44600 [Streptomyces hygroscopicus subsp. sporocinereus]|uniref:Uncharacterized protein n=1 Tax=Streptomyces hygroscopicus TaxID=1912 RepID=A0ABQ3U3Q5_STRHY|nr:hypothetical protein [Streptomyces hygroscopicus]GHJ30027.1 hypothetical protein TPA0910_44600 [Streptomyces hygroscopicus]
MTTPAGAGEPFSEAMGEAVQTSVLAWRLVMAVADAVRRQQQRRKGKEEDLPPADMAVDETSAQVKNCVPPDMSTALMGAADWPQMAQQLMALRSAGVDLSAFLPRVGDIAVTVRDAVAANSARVAYEGTDKWVRVMREALPAGPVREAILSSPTWPDLAATMARLDERGVDVRQVLASAHDEGVGVYLTVPRGLATDSAPTTSRDARMSYGPLTINLDIPTNLELGDRARALHRQLAISPQENERYERWVMEAMPGREREARALVSARRWPLVAARMAHMEADSKPVREHLTRLLGDTSWEQGPPQQMGSRLVSATLEALHRPLGDASVAPVSTAAARSQSVTVAPTKRQAGKSAALAEPGVAPHRQQSGPAPARGRTR